MFKIYKGGEYFYQWDIGQRLLIEDETIKKVHFCNRTGDCALACSVYEEDGLRLVNVPNILLQSTNNIRVYGCIEESEEICFAKEMQIFRVIARNKPEEYVYTEDELKNWDSIDERLIHIEEDISKIEAIGLGNLARKTEVEAVSNRLDTIVAETTLDSDTEVKDIRVGADATVYESAGAAVRAKVNKTDIVSTIGTSEDKVMSQKAVKENFANTTEKGLGAVLDFVDEAGNVALSITEEGHIRTKNFNSKEIKVAPSEDTTLLQEELDLSRCDFGKEMATGINYYVEGDVIVCKCTVSTLAGSILKMFTAVGSGVARGSASFVNFETGVMGMYGGIAATSSALTVKYSKPIGFELVAGHEYVVEMMKKGKAHTIKITDAYTLESDSLTIMPTGSSDLGEHWGKRSYNATEGITVNSFKDYSLQPYDCRLLIIGDSFIEGATGFANHANRYCARLKRLLNGSCAISGFGGATVEQVSAFYEGYCKTLFKPDYVLIACGTNNNTYSSWLTAQKALIASIKAAGSIPVLVTVTRRLDNDNLAFIRQANAWIRNESKELYIDINRITTVNYDGETQNTTMFATDKVHPLPETHKLIAKKALIDVPEVFNLSASYIRNRDNAGGKI